MKIIVKLQGKGSVNYDQQSQKIPRATKDVII